MRILIIVWGMGESIEIDPRVCEGLPVIRGTRIPVSMVLECLSNDESWDSILRGYPELTPKAIKACLQNACHAVLHTEVTELNAA